MAFLSGVLSSYRSHCKLRPKQLKDIRAPRLGKAHHDTITTRHNLAELLILMGNQEAAEEVQRGILADLGASGTHTSH
jgi:hypothetical protein